MKKQKIKIGIFIFFLCVFTNAFAELVIDLHGFSAEKAKFCILHSLAHAHNIDKIRIITGRGNHINKSGESGILYKKFLSWLAESAYQSRIAKILTGDGYYDIYLRDVALEQNDSEQITQLFDDLFMGTTAIETKAGQGDPAAQFYLATYLTFKAADEKNFKKAFYYLLKSAISGYPDAMIAVATRYMVGRGIKQNDKQAIKWLEKALALNHFEAPVLLGDCYWEGHGVEQNPNTAVSYYTMGANLNDPVAMRKLASAYRDGIGIKKNLHLSFEWYKKAADIGEVTSQYNIAVMYEVGFGSGLIAPNSKKAYTYYLLAANGGDPDAQCKIGYFYLTGENVPKNLPLAIKWLTLASNNGSAQAPTLLKQHKPYDLDLLQRSAQAGNIFDSIKLKIQQRGLVATADVSDTIFMESYLELRDLPINNITHLEHKSKFWLIDQMIADKNKSYQKKAIKILQIMTEENCIFSLRRLAHIYHNGRGIKTDDQQAIAYLEQASSLNDGKSTAALAVFYTKGKVAQPSKQNISYYEKAANQDYPPASYYLGVFYLDNGETQKGISYLQKAIDLENNEETLASFSSGFIDKYNPISSDAALRLGLEYLQAEESQEQEMEQGFEYIQLALQLGNKKAEEFLAFAKTEGILDMLPDHWFKPMFLTEEGATTSKETYQINTNEFINEEIFQANQESIKLITQALLLDGRTLNNIHPHWTEADGNCAFTALHIQREEFLKTIDRICKDPTHKLYEQLCSLFLNEIFVQIYGNYDNWYNAIRDGLWAGEFELNLIGLIRNTRVNIFGLGNNRFVEQLTVGDLDALNETRIAFVNMEPVTEANTHEGNHYIELRAIEPNLEYTPTQQNTTVAPPVETTQASPIESQGVELEPEFSASATIAQLSNWVGDMCKLQ